MRELNTKGPELSSLILGAVALFPGLLHSAPHTSHHSTANPMH